MHMETDVIMDCSVIHVHAHGDMLKSSDSKEALGCETRTFSALKKIPSRHLFLAQETCMHKRTYTPSSSLDKKRGKSIHACMHSDTCTSPSSLNKKIRDTHACMHGHIATS
jgi:hypothetical protein